MLQGIRLPCLLQISIGCQTVKSSPCCAARPRAKLVQKGLTVCPEAFLAACTQVLPKDLLYLLWDLHHTVRPLADGCH